MLKIGNVEISPPVALAPMAGVTDLPYRLICKEYGCGLTVTELISAKAVLYNNKNTELLLATDEHESPSALQLFGSDPEIMAKIAARLEERSFDIIDINMGCPVPKVVGNGEGSALMKKPDLVGTIVEAMVKAIKKPVTVKIRSGFSAGMINAVEIAKVAESAGASAVTVHARTREQYYSGEADWNVIADVKAALSIPVIGNGDIKSGADALKMISQTGCDGVMIGRAARGNPWIFTEIKNALENKNEKYPEPTLEEKTKIMLRHTRQLIELKGEYTAVREMRKAFGWYTAGMRNAVAIRREVNKAQNYKELEALVKYL